MLGPCVVQDVGAGSRGTMFVYECTCDNVEVLVVFGVPLRPSGIPHLTEPTLLAVLFAGPRRELFGASPAETPATQPHYYQRMLSARKIGFLP